MKSFRDKIIDFDQFIENLDNNKKTVFIIMSVFYIFLIVIFYPKYKGEILKINLLPIILATVFFGYKIGFLTMIGIDIFLFTYLSRYNVTYDEHLRFFVPGKIIALFLMFCFGVLVEMYKKIIRLNKDLEEISLCDSLTGLYNRRYLEEVVTSLAENFMEEVTNVEVWKRDPNFADKVMGICMIDIDYFKNINDTYGHDTGDIVLKEISTVMKNLVRFDDIVIRWGGEEFIIILNRTKVDYLPKFLKMLKSKITNHQIAIDDNHHINITVSGGCIAYPYYRNNPLNLTFEECINLTDILLYYAKSAGRNQFIVLKSTEQVMSYNELKRLLKLVEKDDPKANSNLFEVV